MATHWLRGDTVTEFKYSPAKCIPFQDMEVVERCRKITRDDLINCPNPNLDVHVMPGHEIDFRWLVDMFYRIKTAGEEGRKCVLICPQPYTGYSKLAWMLNLFKVDCKHLHTFNMDEYADEDGRIAPEDWKPGFLYSMLNNFYAKLDPALRPPREQIQGLTNENINDYGKMIEDLGNADCCYSGPGWTGHVAFVEPDAPELETDLDAWLNMGPRVCTLSPFTIAQNSMHGAFGMSGDLWAVPPKAATIGPAQVRAAKKRIDVSAISVDGSFVSWQRLIIRMCLFGPVTPKLPTSVIQTVPTEVWISDVVAENIEPHWEKGY
jgi:glucosamine-6-phosphate deaminase